ncbi:undecaprenyl-diphosphate phosphatase [Propioniciclava sinopodophylli]|uniref:Undecaprenyl-diphosphatase n=1 Tax=Propioniciclava sinopodophylli TaxID=1837344 RepID=A0A4Q9KDG3_9ACTN|nr:undecaprenyl-diphosphate phosphatase [Propioniciclava sinopodophylli]TBT84392.1 undecaprenyl-diphosphate phosphatase [Propioniciclava sinopodophylli]
MEWWQSVILGVVEGVTEFLPISSTGHLTVVEKLMGLPINDPSVTAYTAIIQIGAMVASIVYFWSDIIRIAGAWFAGLADKAKRGPDFQLGWAVIAGFTVTAVVALLLRDLVEGPLRSLWFVVGGLLLWSVPMFIGDRVGKQNRGEDSITWKDGAILGLIQCLSLVPGVSRSGATITGGLFLGIDRITATRMSFFLGIPTLVAAGMFQAATSASSIAAPGGIGWVATIIGIVVSFVVAYASIAWLLKFVATNDFTAFVIYRVIVGLVIGGLLLANVISPV